jgi:hypothetical protein
MTIVTLLSTCAMALGLGGIVPQLVRMVRSRSAAGQAPLGWVMGMAAHLSMAYVNAVAFKAVLLSASNMIAGTLCALAIALISVLRRRPQASRPELALDELPTHEFAALRDAVLARDLRPRTCRSQPARRAHGRDRTTRGAARTSRA